MKKGSNSSHNPKDIAYDLTPTQFKESTIQEDEDLQYLHPSTRKSYPISMKKALFLVFSILVLVVILVSTYFFLYGDPAVIKPDESYVVPPSFYTTYPDITQIKGKYKEAYAFLLCSSTIDDAGSIHFYFESLLAFILKLKKAREDEIRDIIVLACDLTYDYQFDIIRKTGVLLIPVKVVITERIPKISWWKYNFTKFYLWQLVFWDRILFLDIDLVCDDRLFNIWDDPATKLQTKPPAGIDLDSIWFGQTVRSLYPYIEAYTYDTWSPASKSIESFNNGIFIFKPSLEHYNILMNITYDYSLDLDVMEQTALNIAYSKKGPVPWTTFNETYNMASMIYKEKREWIVCYHGKLWHGEKDDPLHMMWVKGYEEMKRDFYNISIISEKQKCTTKNGIIIINGLNLTQGTGILYYMITQNLEHFPTYEEIKASYLNTSSQEFIIIPHGDKLSTITINNLAPNIDYRIFYFAETFSRFNPMTNIYYRNCTAD